MVYGLEDITWGGSGIERVVFDFIRSHIPEGSTVLELGAGKVSTPALNLFYDLYSVEHNPDFMDLFTGVNYIHAPLVDGWYDLSILKNKLPKKYSLVLVDGINRGNIIENIDLFDKSALYVVHDTYREQERLTAIALSEMLNREVKFHEDGDYWASIW